MSKAKDEASKLLQEVSDVLDERNTTHGDPEDNLGQIAEMWSALFGIEVTATEVCHAMVLVKISRDSVGKQTSRDDFEDICGYASLGYGLTNEVQDEPPEPDGYSEEDMEPENIEDEPDEDWVPRGG